MMARPSLKPSPLTSVWRPSLMPVFTSCATAWPSLSTQICRRPGAPPLVSVARRGVVLRGMRGIILDRMLLGAAAAPLPAVVGEKRNAVLGTSSTPLRSVATMVAAAVMPGRRLRSVLSTSSVVT